MKDLVQYFVSAILGNDIKLLDLNMILKDALGAIEGHSGFFPCEKVNHHTSEMGGGLNRIFFHFESLSGPSELVAMKTHCMELENTFFLKGGKKIVNLDPGYIDSLKIVFASSKPGDHKIALTDKIYADMVLDSHKGAFRSFDWSFEDFKSKKYYHYFYKLKGDYVQKLRRMNS